MKRTEVMKQLKEWGSEQTRKTYRRHGIDGNLYGVKHGDLNKLVRKLKRFDGVHELAMELWGTGNFDARVLATMIVDPSRMTMTALNSWLKDVDNHGLSSALSNVAQRSPKAVQAHRKWKTSRKELVAATAWMMVPGIAREVPDAMTKTEYRELLKEIETKIHAAPNRVRYAMNAAVIGIGTYINERSAVASAKRIGPVDVDHGDTSCTTPSAETYIVKAAARHREKLAKAAAKVKPRAKAKA